MVSLQASAKLEVTRGSAHTGLGQHGAAGLPAQFLPEATVVGTSGLESRVTGSQATTALWESKEPSNTEN